MSENFSERIRNMSQRARILTAVIMAVVLLLIGAGCAMFSLLMMAFSTDACTSTPGGSDFFLFLPTLFLGLGALLPAILFALRKSTLWVAGSFCGSYVLAALAGVGWFGLVAISC